jgi:DNA polymerase-1
MYISVNKLAEIKKAEQEKADNLKKSVCEAYDLEDINFRSSKQMKHLVFDLIGAPVTRKTKVAKEPSTDEDALALMVVKMTDVNKIDHLNAIHKARSALYNCSKVDELFAAKRDDGTVSTSFAYTVSGRFKSSKPNLQNFPTDGIVKEGIESRWEGGKIIEADYKQLEVGLIAGESNCRDLIKARSEGRDTHQETNIRFQLRDRYKAKRTNFSVIYGVGAGTLSKEIKIQYTDARQYIGEQSRLWWEIPVWRQRQVEFCRTHGYVVNRFGRRRRLPNISSTNDHLRFEAERQAGNFPIQSLGVDTLNFAMILMETIMHPRNILPSKHPFQSIIINQQHDALLLDYHPEDSLEKVKELLQACMVTRMMRFGYYDKVPLKIDISIGDHWVKE